MAIAYPKLASPSERNSVPAPETDRIIALTPHGEAVRHLYRFTHALADLDAAGRADVLELLKVEIREMPVTA
jgi:hypothetical protein